jgi:hypothetical protein
MASKITAIRRYKPEIKRERTRRMREVVEDISQQTGLSEGEILHVVYELRDAILNAHRIGKAVKIQGLGIYTPVMRMDGSLDIVFRPEVELLRSLNNPTKLYIEILNKSNIGKSSKELIAQWNKDHPDDLVK